MTSLRRLVGLPVTSAGDCSGAVEDAVLAADLSTVLGVVVGTGRERRCFLPWAATRLDGDGLVPSTAMAMLGEVELAYYLASGVRLTSLTGLEVHDADGGASALSDVIVGDEGRIEGLELTHGGWSWVLPLCQTRLERGAGETLELHLRRAANGGRSRRPALLRGAREPRPERRPRLDRRIRPA